LKTPFKLVSKDIYIQRWKKTKVMGLRSRAATNRCVFSSRQNCPRLRPGCC